MRSYLGADSSQFFEPNSEELASIIRDGDIPLISIYNANIEPFDNDAKIVRYRPGQMQYVAISHVWSDGLGNPFANAIYHCQIGALAKSLTQFGAHGLSSFSDVGSEDPLDEVSDSSSDSIGDGRLYFWIDTICVPVQPPIARKEAIRSISKVFKEAKATLVMAMDLERVSLPETALETASRILVSSWTRRLWTYSEAMLTGSLAFMFNDGWTWLSDAIGSLVEQAQEDPRVDYLGSISDLVSEISAPWTLDGSITKLIDNCDPGSAPLRQSPDACRLKIASLAAGAGSDAFKFSEQHKAARLFLLVIQGLPWKSTSKAFDELICLAQLRGIDIEHLTTVHGDFESAMEKFLELQISFPRGFVFCTAQRMAKPGFRWAPRSFIGECLEQADIEKTFVTPSLALFSLEGLVVCFPGIILESFQPILRPRRGPYKQQIRRWLEVYGPTSYTCWMAIDPCSYNPSDLAPEGQKWQNMAIIVNTAPSLLIAERETVTGVLVNMSKREGDIIHAAFVCTLKLGRLAESSHVEKLNRRGMEEASHKVLHARELLAEAQAWCLS